MDIAQYPVFKNDRSRSAALIFILALARKVGRVDGDANPAVAAEVCFASDADDVFMLENPNLDMTSDVRIVVAIGAPANVQRDYILVLN